MVAKASFYVPTSMGPKGHCCWYLKTHFLELLQLKFNLKYFRKYFFWNYFNLTSVGMVPSRKHILWLAVRPRSACSQSRIPKVYFPKHLHQRIPTYRASAMGAYVSLIRFASSPSFTPCDRCQRSKILFWNYLNLTTTEMIQFCKYIQLLANNFQPHQPTPSTMEHSFEITST